MQIPDDLYKWLKAGFRQSEKEVSEAFYFDNRDNEFFSILIADYFLFTDNFEIDENAKSSYSEIETKILRDRLNRVQSNDSIIISLPRIGKTAESHIVHSNIESFIKANKINIETAHIWSPPDGDIIIDL
jgi:hypothetical protein